MATLNYAVSVSGMGISISQSMPRTTDGGSSREAVVPVGYAGTLTTRTDDNTGTITLGAGHGITTGMLVDIYWASGVHYKVTVGTVSGNSVPFDGGIGDVLPIATTAVIVSPRVLVNAAIDGDALALLALNLKYTNLSALGKGHVDFMDVANAEIEELDLQQNVVQVYDITGGAANVFTGNPITKLYVSNGSSIAAAVFQIAWCEDTTP